MQVQSYAVDGPKEKFHPWPLHRREVGDDDVLIKILYCGICHSDIHTARSEWSQTRYPYVGGHEIVGKVEKVGKNVSKFKTGDTAAVGCIVDSCAQCPNCKNHEEQFCSKGMSGTYNSLEQDKKTPTYGGYSEKIVVKENYVVKVPAKFKDSELAAVAPLLCAGITTYSPLHHHKDKVVGKKVGIVGLGGLGHVGVKIAAAMGAEVTVFSTSDSKRKDAERLGAKHFVVTKNEEELKKIAGTLSLIVNTVSAEHDVGMYLSTLATNGVMIYVGASPDPLKFRTFSLIGGRKAIEGSLIGGIKETQEMLDFCAEKGIVADIELIGFDKIEEAYDRTVKSDVKNRFVLDISTINK
jgi:uncharacterized zinc-type alcohol dehydrogenase-like protein